MVTVQASRLGDRRWTYIPASRTERFVMGVDLGQSMDPTAISVIHRTAEPLDDWEIVGDRGGAVRARQRSDVRYDVRHLERVPLGTPYPGIMERVAHLMARPPLRDECDLVLDETGVGRAVSDIFETAGMRPQRVAITAGSETTDQGDRRWHVPKATLISTVDASLHTGELRFAAALTDAGALADELRDFRRKVSDSGRATYSARTGRHDDLILSIAIALWWAGRRRAGSSAGRLVGLY